MDSIIIMTSLPFHGFSFLLAVHAVLFVSCYLSGIPFFVSAHSLLCFVSPIFLCVCISFLSFLVISIAYCFPLFCVLPYDPIYFFPPPFGPAYRVLLLLYADPVMRWFIRKKKLNHVMVTSQVERFLCNRPALLVYHVLPVRLPSGEKGKQVAPSTAARLI